MNLYILRHAKAEEHSSRYPDDSKRPLTDAGEKEMFGVAEGMRALELNFDLILSSPFVRAKRTAEIAAEVLESDRLHFSDHLASDGDARKLIDELHKEYSSCENILLVGHEPYLSKLISVLSTGTDKLQLSFKKAGLAKLVVEKLEYKRCASVDFLLRPGHLVQMRESAKAN